MFTLSTLRRLAISGGLCLALILGGIAPIAAQDGPVTITILNTADEHGWLQPTTPFGSDETLGGAANIYARWVQDEGYDPDTMLLLSGGDNWTGPAISTWFEGEPVVELFNAMGYDATAIGNHEFDFGRDVLAERIAASEYPYLAANILETATGELADFALPYVIDEVNGVQVGIVGLATTATATTTSPVNISDLTFAPYAETLQAIVPQMRAEGAQVIVGLTHICVNELSTLATQVGGLVDALFGGHCNAFTSTEVNGIPIIGSGSYWQSYARLDLTYDPAEGRVIDSKAKLVRVAYEGETNPVTPNPDIAAIVDGWQARVDAALDQVIGYTAEGIAQRSPAMVNLLTDAWLWAYSEADAAVTNYGGFRQAIDAGPITMADIVAVLPFDNYLYAARITGAQLAENLACCSGAVGGISYVRRGASVEITFLDGQPVDPAATYTVLVSDFMYFGGDGYLFGQQDPDAYSTGIHWRQPLIDWLLQHPTTQDDPLENYLDPVGRGE
jgi:5'-nucleotidase/UDP-sugar diphosphatase